MTHHTHTTVPVLDTNTKYQYMVLQYAHGACSTDRFLLHWTSVFFWTYVSIQPWWVCWQRVNVMISVVLLHQVVSVYICLAMKLLALHIERVKALLLGLLIARVPTIWALLLPCFVRSQPLHVYWVVALIHPRRSSHWLPANMSHVRHKLWPHQETMLCRAYCLAQNIDHSTLLQGEGCSQAKNSHIYDSKTSSLDSSISCWGTEVLNSWYRGVGYGALALFTLFTSGRQMSKGHVLKSGTLTYCSL